ncbi:hypothetical protein [Paraburkholderia kururiensis]|uniref:Uncharacterized protein n=1 Tax=Paraburkholderia kururiensis TaxID=984307 RepID=A0ABZ0WNE7_9BURK|nr:hypothetical protein [Paraburkholderia kururiensis]WQD78909.1 hypothetical protein U0042_04150 [Paraburkholderia kururiensis]
MKVRTFVLMLALTTGLASVPSAFAQTQSQAAAVVAADADSQALFGATRLAATQESARSATWTTGTTGTTSSGTTIAALGTDALSRVSGNVGVNVAAGALNVQANQIALVSGPQVDVDTKQQTEAAVRLELAASKSAALAASLGAGALAGASGNIGVNLAAGVGNVQVNLLAVR